MIFSASPMKVGALTLEYVVQHDACSLQPQIVVSFIEGHGEHRRLFGGLDPITKDC